MDISLSTYNSPHGALTYPSLFGNLTSGFIRPFFFYFLSLFPCKLTIRASLHTSIPAVICIRSKPEMIRVYAQSIVPARTIMQHPQSIRNYTSMKNPAGHRSSNLSAVFLSICANCSTLIHSRFSSNPGPTSIRFLKLGYESTREAIRQSLSRKKLMSNAFRIQPLRYKKFITEHFRSTIRACIKCKMRWIYTLVTFVWAIKHYILFIWNFSVKYHPQYSPHQHSAAVSSCDYWKTSTDECRTPNPTRISYMDFITQTFFKRFGKVLAKCEFWTNLHLSNQVHFGYSTLPTASYSAGAHFMLQKTEGESSA